MGREPELAYLKIKVDDKAIISDPSVPLSKPSFNEWVYDVGALNDEAAREKTNLINPDMLRLSN